MTDKRMIVVESCYDCVRKGYRVGCPKNKHTFSGLPMPASCPLPKWPSTDMGTIELFLKAAEEVGVSPTYLAA